LSIAFAWHVGRGWAHGLRPTLLLSLLPYVLLSVGLWHGLGFVGCGTRLEQASPQCLGDFGPPLSTLHERLGARQLLDLPFRCPRAAPVEASDLAAMLAGFGLQPSGSPAFCNPWASRVGLGGSRSPVEALVIAWVLYCWGAEGTHIEEQGPLCPTAVIGCQSCCVGERPLHSCRHGGALGLKQQRSPHLCFVVVGAQASHRLSRLCQHFASRNKGPPVAGIGQRHWAIPRVGCTRCF
jgi:hypothetical protein